MTLVLGSAPEDLRVVLPFQAAFASRVRLTVDGEDEPDWGEFTLRLEIGDFALTAELIEVGEPSEGVDAFARFEFTVAEADANYSWWSRAARLEVERAGVTALTAFGVAEVSGR